MIKPFRLFLLFKLIFTGVQLLYNIVLASIAQQSVSVIYINTSPFYEVPFHLRVPYAIQHVLTSHFREGNGTPLQYSCLENPVDGGAW